MLYARYSNPMDLIGRYINQGRFGEFVSEFLTLENERRKEEDEKQKHNDMWAMYIHSYTDEDFDAFCKRILKPVSTTKGGTTRACSDADLDEQGVNAIMNSLFT